MRPLDTRISTAIVVTAVLVMTHVPRAVGQRDRKANGRETALHDRRAEELLQSALLLVDTKDRELARQRMQEAMSLWVRRDESEKAAKAALQLGDAYAHARDYIASLQCYKQAMGVKPLSGSIRASINIAIGRVYTELFEPELAKKFFIRAVELTQAAKDRSAEALALVELAALYHGQGERGQARACIKQARRTNGIWVSQAAKASFLHTAGQISQREGLLDEARTAFEEALIIYQRIGDIEGQVRVLCSLTDLSLLALENRAALDHAKQAVDLAEGQAHHAQRNPDRVRGRGLRWRAWFSRARAERATGQNQLAFTSYFSALAHAESVLVLEKMSTETRAIGFREETQGFYRGCVDLLMDQGEVNRAFWWANAAKARAIRSATQARRRPGSTGHPDQAGQRDGPLRSIARLRTQLVFSNSRVELETLQQELRDAEDALDEQRVQAEMSTSRDGLVWAWPVSVKSVQERLAQDKSALLEFLLGETRSFAWLITPDAVSYAILPGRKEIEKAVRPYLQALTTAPNYLHLQREVDKTRRQGAALFSCLFGDLAGHINQIQKLVVVPDGILHYLPFETLIHDSRYLIQDYEISYNPSASMLSLRQDSRSRNSERKKMELLAFGDPVFERISTARTKTPGGRREMRQPVRAGQGYNFTQLPRTRDEVETIAGLFPTDRRRVYLGLESTEDAIKRESLRDYERLHIATHSLTDEQSTSRSAVVFTLDEDPQEDGLLEVGEISELDLDCELVVLSACQTGRGRLFSGEGIVGLSRAFLIAGARSTVVSLWNVSDAATGRLMKAFYQQLVADVGSAAALRAAKLQMPELAREFRHPYYWASFVIIGNP